MILRRVARPLLGAAIIASGVDAVRAPSAAARTADPLLDSVPADSETVIRVAGAVQIGAGVALATGRAPRLAAAILTGTLVPTTVLASDFWNETDPAAKQVKRSEFVKNLGLVGGAMIAAADTEGRPSIAWRGRRRLDGLRTTVDAHSTAGVTDRLEQVGERAQHWAHDVADRLPLEAAAERTAQVADSALTRAQEAASTVAERTPALVETVRDHVDDLADEASRRVPVAAARTRETVARSGGRAFDALRRLPLAAR